MFKTTLATLVLFVLASSATLADIVPVPRAMAAAWQAQSQARQAQIVSLTEQVRGAEFMAEEVFRPSLERLHVPLDVRLKESDNFRKRADALRAEINRLLEEEAEGHGRLIKAAKNPARAASIMRKERIKALLLDKQRAKQAR